MGKAKALLALFLILPTLLGSIGCGGSGSAEPENGEVAPSPTGANSAEDPAKGQALEPICRTEWRPLNCRTKTPTVDAMPLQGGYRIIHGGLTNADETPGVISTSFEQEWIAEPGTINAVGPVFDDDGNLYLTPLFPAGSEILIAVDGETGARRWAITGNRRLSGGGSALVLADPANPTNEIVYVGLYDRVVAVRTDGEIVWDKPTGLVDRSEADWPNLINGISYIPHIDAIAGLTMDGYIYLLDRTSGSLLLNEPYQLPGEKSPPGAALNYQSNSAPNYPSDSLWDISFLDPSFFNSWIYGYNLEAANFFAVDPLTGRLWVTATAPDGLDGTIDGVSELGALYGISMARREDSVATSIRCSRYFRGGSASAPTLSSDGSRIYLGDNEGLLLAIDSDCNTLWELDMGKQVVGSISVSSDNSEIFLASSDNAINKLIDQGDHAEIVWQRKSSLFPGEENGYNSNLLAIGSNAIAYQAGTSPWGAEFMTRVGVGVLDRETGEVRHFAEGLDESTGVITVGPNGDIYIGNSPSRRSKTFAIYGPDVTPPPIGGVSKFKRANIREFISEIGCSGATRAANSARHEALCPTSADADAEQIQLQIKQARRALSEGLSTKTINVELVDDIELELSAAEKALISSDRNFTEVSHALARITHLLLP